MAKLLKQYSGRLTPSQTAEGMNAAARNARRLAADARLLLDAGRYASAAALAALAIEEAGKISILRGIALARTDGEAQRGWRQYRSHTHKNAHWIFPEVAVGGARRLDDFGRLYDRDSDHPLVLDKIKQVGLYSDCTAQTRWIEPGELIERSLAERLVRTAEVFGKGKETTVREMELWVQHLGPVWGGKVTWMKKALSNWHRAMLDEGLVSADSVSMDEFLGLSDRADTNGA